MNRLYPLFLAVLFMIMHIPALFARVDMADELRASGKIYVVVVVMAVIFAGLIIYLIRLDMKISKIEKSSKLDQ